MKKLFTLLCLLMIMGAQSMAQKFALVDMEYILKNIPAYERASEQLNQVSKKWQAEVDALTEEAQTLYKNYQSEAVFLSTEQKTKKEEEIVAKEKEAAELKKKYFGPEGELFKKRASMVCEKSLAYCAREFGLPEFILLGRGEEMMGGRKRDYLLRPFLLPFF